MKKFTGLAAAVLFVTCLFAGCGINYNAKLITITHDGELDQISLGYGNFVARYTQAIYDSSYGSILSDGFWDSDMYGKGNTMEEDTKDAVLDEMKAAYLCKIHAADYGIELTDEQTKAIDAAAKKFMESNSEEALSELGAKEEYVRDYLTYETYYTLVKEKVDAEAPTENSTEDDDTAESQTYFDEKKAEWEAGLTWTVDEKQWKKVKYENKFTAASEETSEE